MNNYQLDAKVTIDSLTWLAKCTNSTTSYHMTSDSGAIVEMTAVVYNGILFYELGCGIYGYRTPSASDAIVRIANALEVA